MLGLNSKVFNLGMVFLFSIVYGFGFLQLASSYPQDSLTIGSSIWIVPGDYPNIQSALNGANSGDTILVAAGVYTESLDFGSKDITLQSQEGATQTIISSSGGTAVTIGPGGKIIGFTISKGFASFGAGMSVIGAGTYIKSNIFEENYQGSGGFGAAIGGNSASPLIEGNIFRLNSCDSQWLSGVVGFVNSSSPVVINNIFENNPCRAINFTLPTGNSPQVINNTIVSNAVGIRVDGRIPTSLQVFRNNIIYQNDIGLQVDFGTAANNPTWENNLVFSNTVDYAGIDNQTGINGNLSIDPRLRDPASADFRLRLDSPAIDWGSNNGCSALDFRGVARPQGAGCDIGAFEFALGSLAVSKDAVPSPVLSGGQLTYTIRITNTDIGDLEIANLHVTLTDTLPSQIISGLTSAGAVISPDEIITWTPVISAPGGIWNETIVVTVTPGYAGWLTNTVQATSEEGPSGIYTATTLSLAPYLEVSKQATPAPVQAGALLTYTIRVTNTGTMDLHATITDTLPAQLTSGRTSSGTVMLPGQPFTWTAFIPAGDVWRETAVGTVAWGYTGTLTNVVQVTTLEGATGIYTATTQAQVTPALTVTKQANSITVRAGEQLTYTIRITNTGNITLTGIVTDTLPLQVVPSGVQTWMLANLSPGNVWAQSIAVTVTRGYSGTLINRVQVTTQEGAKGETQVILNAIGYQVYLPIVLK